MMLPGPGTREPRLLLTCEHGGRRIPAGLRSHFSGSESVVESHRGWDPGALTLARALSRSTGAPLLATTVSRLVVDANRSKTHPQLFSPWTRPLPPEERREIVRRWWTPHWDRVEKRVDRWIAEGALVVHLGIHTFTGFWDGVERGVDAALLYDPRRPEEAAWGSRLLMAIAGIEPPLRLRRNHPYRGTADGLVTALRKRFPPDAYLGLELEVSQTLVAPGAPAAGRLRGDLVRALTTALPRVSAPSDPSA